MESNEIYASLVRARGDQLYPALCDACRAKAEARGISLPKGHPRKEELTAFCLAQQKDFVDRRMPEKTRHRLLAGDAQLLEMLQVASDYRPDGYSLPRGRPTFAFWACAQTEEKSIGLFAVIDFADGSRDLTQQLSDQDIQVIWSNLPEDLRGPHPLAAITELWLRRPRSPARSHLTTPVSGIVRAPAALSVSVQTPLVTLNVDGNPFATALPSANKRTFYQLATHEQIELLPLPRVLSGQPVADMVISTFAQYDLNAFRRSTLRSDVYRLSLLAFALSGPTKISEEMGIYFLTQTSSMTQANLRRWWAAVGMMDSLRLIVDPATGKYITMGRAEGVPGGYAVIGPPGWWNGKGQNARWVLTGGLFRPQITSRQKGKRGPKSDNWGGLQRTLAGVEAMLQYGPTAGRGREGRIPDAMRAVRKGGPADPVLVPWRTFIQLAGETVDEKSTGACLRRYRRRVNALIDAGYLTRDGKAASVGDTCEIVKDQKGRRGRKTGVWVRASARFVEAYKQAQKRKTWTRVPATQVLEPKPS